jgi:hypothetical protein
MSKKYQEDDVRLLLEKFRLSNSSIKGFARDENIPESTLRDWIAKQSQQIKFGEIQLNETSQKTVTSRPHTIFVTENIRIELKENYDKELLKNILEVLLNAK